MFCLCCQNCKIFSLSIHDTYIYSLASDVSLQDMKQKSQLTLSVWEKQVIVEGLRETMNEEIKTN